MSKKLFFCMLFALSALFLNIALAGMPYPSEFSNEIDIYPDASVKQTMKVPGSTMAVLECAGKVAEIFDYYKNKLESNGWKIVNEFKSEGDSALVGEKSGRTFMVGIGPDPSGKVMVSLALSEKK